MYVLHIVVMYFPGDHQLLPNLILSYLKSEIWKSASNHVKDKRMILGKTLLVKSHVKQVKSWVKCKDFKIRTPILGVGDPLVFPMKRIFEYTKLYLNILKYKYLQIVKYSFEPDS